jgi:hypothetical protein
MDRYVASKMQSHLFCFEYNEKDASRERQSHKHVHGCPWQLKQSWHYCSFITIKDVHTKPSLIDQKRYPTHSVPLNTTCLTSVFARSPYTPLALRRSLHTLAWLSLQPLPPTSRVFLNWQ